MRRLLRAAALALCPSVAMAQTGIPVSSAPVAVVRALDKLTGETADLELVRGQMRQLGTLSIVLGDCRFPTADPSSDAFAWLEVRDPALQEPAFTGWMVASSPALHAMDHPRYDLWVLRCRSS